MHKVPTSKLCNNNISSIRVHNPDDIFDFDLRRLKYGFKTEERKRNDYKKPKLKNWKWPQWQQPDRRIRFTVLRILPLICNTFTNLIRPIRPHYYTSIILWALCSIPGIRCPISYLQVYRRPVKLIIRILMDHLLRRRTWRDLRLLVPVCLKSYSSFLYIFF